jgi:dTMP kinase
LNPNPRTLAPSNPRILDETLRPKAGRLIAFEGLDQSGKETQARLLRGRLERAGHRVESLTFPDDSTPLGHEIRAALDGARAYPPDVMQLLYIANRHERGESIARWLADGVVVICDRYLASSIAYGEAQGLDAAWLTETQRFLPQPALTILLDIAPETALARKQGGRDRYERDLELLARVRASYRRLARQPGWMLVDGERPRDDVESIITSAVASRLGLP